MYIILLIISIIFAILFYFSWSISLGIYLRSICRAPKATKNIALTFDDGVDPQTTPRLLKLLDEYQVKASFFIIGSKAKQYPELVRQIHSQGHTIGNHSMWHKPSFPIQSRKRILTEILECKKVIEDITGENNIYFRPPFGVSNPPIGKAVTASGLISIGWSIRSYDTVKQDVKKIYSRVIDKIDGGDIILLHDNRVGTLELTDMLLTYIRDNGYKAVSINELLN